MDTQSPLAIESFSCSWLPKSRPSLDSLDREELLDPGACSHQDFYFDVPPDGAFLDSFAHADELFSNGVIKAVRLDETNSQTLTMDSRDVSGEDPGRCSMLRRWRKSFERSIWRCFRYVGPFLARLANTRGRTRDDDIDRRKYGDKGRAGPRESSSSSQRGSNSRCFDEQESSTEENSIYEAVLHCKRSIGRTG